MTAGEASSKIIDTIDSSLIEAERRVTYQTVNVEEDYFSQSAIDVSLTSDGPPQQDKFKSPPQVIDASETS